MSMAKRNLFAHLTAAALTDVGRKRKNNEDSFGAFPEFGVWCVADGMGGGDDGEVASAAVVKSVDAFLSDLPTVNLGAYTGSFIANGIVAAIEEASGWIFRRTKKNNLKGCGSTFVGIVFDATDPAAAVALHAGDSRLYRFRGRELKQITKDHSVAEMMGAKDETQLNPMFRGMILRAVGVESSVEVEQTPLSLEAGDIILVCSDGLSRMVPDKRIAEIIREGTDNVEGVAKRLIAEANEAGGVDNITVELIRVGTLPPPARAANLPRSDESSVSSTTVRTLDRVYGERRSKVSRGVWLFLVGVVAVLALAWVVLRAFTIVRESRAPALPPEDAAEVQTVTDPEPERLAETNAVPTDVAPIDVAPTSAVPVIAVATNAVPPEIAPTNEVPTNAVAQAAAVADERERDVVAGELKAMRERRQRDEASAARSEEERRQVAGELARTYDREFTDFACLANRALGRGACDRAYLLGRKLNSRRRDVDAPECAVEFVGAVQALAADIVGKLGPKAEGKAGSAVEELLSRCRALDGLDPALPETQRQCLELMRFVATRRMGNNGGR